MNRQETLDFLAEDIFRKMIYYCNGSIELDLQSSINIINSHLKQNNVTSVKLINDIPVILINHQTYWIIYKFNYNKLIIKKYRERHEVINYINRWFKK